MLHKLKEIRALNAFAKKQSVGMQRKLMLYWVSMILVIFAAVSVLCVAFVVGATGSAALYADF